ncbi:hypothetical protein [Streptomyces sp. bgisy100]|uniref:hypothetical protein n=1 Tax=Streptomyces sp. bgisy100 TaxID=3413783 RepID=UPI003D7218A8
MRRHDLEPGKLIAGLVLLTAGLLRVLDATDVWETALWVLIPVVVGGLSLAALASVYLGTGRGERG